MVRWTLLLTVSVFAGAASLTWWRAPSLWLWKAAILVGEFGHGLVVVPMMIGVAAWWQGGVLCGVIVAISAATSVALLRPLAQAVWIARALPK